MVVIGRGGGTKKKVGGLTLPLNDCTEAGVQVPVLLSIINNDIVNLL